MNNTKVHLSEKYTLKRGDLDQIRLIAKCEYQHAYNWWNRIYKNEENVKGVEMLKAATLLIMARRAQLQEIEAQLDKWIEEGHKMPSK